MEDGLHGQLLRVKILFPLNLSRFFSTAIASVGKYTEKLMANGTRASLNFYM